MKYNKNSINSQINEIKNSRQDKYQFINYDIVLQKQQEVINNLAKEIILLKSYISLENTLSYQPNSDFIMPTPFIKQQNDSKSTKQNSQELIKSAQQQKYQKFIKHLIEILDLKLPQNLQSFDLGHIIDSINKIKEQAIKKNQPIFIQKIKQIKVPITVQKIIEKIVERPVQKIVEKIVYVSKEGNEKTLFKEKIVDKPSDRRNYQQQTQYYGLNKTYSQKQIKPKDRPVDQKKNYYGDRDKKIDRDTLDYYKPDSKRYGEPSNNLIKKRDATKYYNQKRDYY